LRPDLPKSPSLAGLDPADNQKADLGWDDLPFIQTESGLTVVPYVFCPDDLVVARRTDINWPKVLAP
jgi:hypothetical protein